MGTFEYERNGDGVRLTGYDGDETEVAIPSEIDGMPVTAIGSGTFYDNGLHIEKITVPSSVKVIEPHAFELCASLRELKLSEGLQYLGAGFAAASELREVEIPSTVAVIEEPQNAGFGFRVNPGNPVYHGDGYGLYRGGVLLSVNPFDDRTQYAVEEGTEEIGEHVFDDVPALTEVILPASVSRIAEGTLTNVRDPFALTEGIRKISVSEKNRTFLSLQNFFFERLEGGGRRLLRYTGGQSVWHCGDEVYEIGAESCRKSGLREIFLPPSVRRIGRNAFAECPLQTVHFENEEGGESLLYIPQADSYLKEHLLEQFGVNGKRYDYQYYDFSLHEDRVNPDRLRMAFCRLEYPEDLSAETEEHIEKFIQTHMPWVMHAIAEADDMELLHTVADFGFITERNISLLIDRMNQEGQHKVLAFLMDYKNRMFGSSSFDFSL